MFTSAQQAEHDCKLTKRECVLLEQPCNRSVTVLETITFAHNNCCNCRQRCVALFLLEFPCFYSERVVYNAMWQMKKIWG